MQRLLPEIAFERLIARQFKIVNRTMPNLPERFAALRECSRKRSHSRRA